MKILHVTKKYPEAIGGDAVVVANLEKSQRLLDHEVIILTSNCDEIKNTKRVYKFGLKDKSAALDNIGAKRLLSLGMLLGQSYKILKKEHPDVIHTHSIDMAFIVSFAARYFKIPIVHTFHVVTFNDPRQTGIRSKVELFLLRAAKVTKIFVLNPADIADLNRAGFSNVVHVPNGVNVTDWKSSGKTTKNKAFTFIAVGRLEEQKGFVYLIEAAKKLNEAGMRFQVQIVGEGALHENLKQCIVRYKMQDRVHLLGRRSPSELRTLYSRADTFVLSSLWEGMPLTLLEAWASSLPSISTAVNSVPYIAKDVSLLVPTADADALSRAMEVLMLNKAKRDILSKVSYAKVSSEFTWERITQQLLKEYDTAVTA